MESPQVVSMQSVSQPPVKYENLNQVVEQTIEKNSTIQSKFLCKRSGGCHWNYELEKLTSSSNFCNITQYFEALSTYNSI
nr:hypothetical protein [Tanacetum cinerariifolium]